MENIKQIYIIQHTGKITGGPHYDIRIEGDRPSIYYSWRIVKNEPPKPLELEENGKRLILIQTVLHSHEAAKYEGKYKNSFLKIYYQGKIKVIKERLNYNNKGGKHFIVFYFLSGKYKGQKWIMYELNKQKHIWTLFRGKNVKI